MHGIGRALTGLAALAAAGAAGAEPAETLTVTGAAILDERIAPPPDAALRIDLHEAEARDPHDPGAVVASVSVPLERGRTPFALEVPRMALVFGSDYALALRSEGGLVAHADPARLRPDGDATEADELVLRTGLPPLGFGPGFRCDDGLEARVGRVAGAEVLEIGGTRFAAVRERTASGFRMAAAEAPDTYLWEKSGEALVSLHGEERGGCRLIAAAPAPPGAAALAGEWTVEDVAGRGVIDRSRLTLAFEAGGGLSGRGGCNAYSTRYAANGAAAAGALHVGPALAVGAKACAEALERQERRFLDLLRHVRAYRLDGDRTLILTAGDGARLLARR
ncbi:MAG: META domain-containing protein [Paracoccaceae bacterium]